MTGLIAHPNSRSLLVDGVTGKPFQRPPEEGIMIPGGILCERHWRLYRHRTKLHDPKPFILALVDVAFSNTRFAKLSGFDPKSGTKASIRGANAALERIRPLCCFLSAPEVRAAIEAASTKDGIERAAAKRKEQAEAADLRAFADRIKAEFGLSEHDTQHVVTIVRRRELLLACLHGARQRGEDLVAAVESLARSLADQNTRA